MEAALAFFTEELGLRVDAVFPADAPSIAVLSGHGIRLRLDREAVGDRGVLRFLCEASESGDGDERELIAPNGTRILLVPERPTVVFPGGSATIELTRMGDDATWGVGRAGMRYRDLLPERQGGRFVASHIRIEKGGPVPDYVHFHRVRFQMIFCTKGWVRVAYEDQGPPLVMEPGDCVLQPPGIRHRVLECSPGLEVIEIGCPAEHETLADHELSLPTEELRPERLFEGQRFLHHQAASALWSPGRLTGFECRETGMASATGGLADACVIRPRGPEMKATRHAGEFLFYFVLQGGVTLACDGRDHGELAEGDAFALPAGAPYVLTHVSGDLELLEVRLPAAGPLVDRPSLT